MDGDHLTGSPFLGGLRLDVCRKILLRSDGVDPDAARESACSNDFVRNLFDGTNIKRS